MTSRNRSGEAGGTPPPSGAPEDPPLRPGAPDGSLVFFTDPAGRPRGTGFAADHHGTVITGHETVDGLSSLVLRTAGGRHRVVTAAEVTALPELGLALVRAEGLGLEPLAVTVRDRPEAGTYVRIAAGCWREARLLGTADVTYTATDRLHRLHDVLELAVGTSGPGRAAAGRRRGRRTGARRHHRRRPRRPRYRAGLRPPRRRLRRTAASRARPPGSSARREPGDGPGVRRRPQPGRCPRAHGDLCGAGRAVAERPETAGHVAAYTDRRLDEQGPAARGVLLPLVTGLLDGGPEQVRAALAGVLAADGAPGSGALRRELREHLLAHEDAPIVLEALLRAAASRGGPGRRDLVHRTARLLVRTPDGAARLDRCLVDLARHLPGFAGEVTGWLAEAPEEWAALAGPSALRTVGSLAGVRVPA
ncbi:hypothetical protein [Streptomyces sp. NPDC006384]|uniref:hypothetical protein n=1 Tax=Streptomyces sp. NPDC006384 TaxID=3364745 RepID=UPI00368E5532